MVTSKNKKIIKKSCIYVGFGFTTVEIPCSHCSQNNNNHWIYQMFYILPPLINIKYNSYRNPIWNVRKEPFLCMNYKNEYRIHIESTYVVIILYMIFKKKKNIILYMPVTIYVRILGLNFGEIMVDDVGQP